MSDKIISDRVKRVAAAVMLTSFGITSAFSPVAFAGDGHNDNDKIVELEKNIETLQKEPSEKEAPQAGQAHTKEYAQFIIDAPYYRYIKGDHQRTVGMTGKAYIKEGRTMLPMRFVAYTLGMEVSYDDRTRTATFVNNDTGANALSPGKLVINIDTGRYRLYNEKGERYALQIDIPRPDNIDGHIYFPVSRVAALFGASQGDRDWQNTIVWHDKDRVVNIFKDVK
ncbi:copper amine oxidase N-terminal domain-containing protein [Peptococcus simiae]|uniref:copper amine oxidase N-terminal domain-containing protein n=1 Tax=Peptococcus simiae TaxID=1643805 RepID=UPI0039800849